NPEKVTASLNHISEMDVKLTVLEDDFSYTLGEGSRWLERLLMITLLLAVLTVESTGLLLTFVFSRNLSRTLKELNEVALHVSEGNFDQKAPVRSEDELGQLAESLNEMTSALKQSIGKRIEAENASLVKTLFLANMSHEIRTPLGAILGFSELLRDPQLSLSEREQYIDIIQKTGGNLTKIINDILDISKVEAGRLKIERSHFSLSELVGEVHSVLSLKCAEKDLSFVFEKQAEGWRTSHADVFYSDAIRLRQILINVIGNAVKFTEPGGFVEVKYNLKGSKLIFIVRDNGIGIPKERENDLFQVFSQGDHYLTKRYQGTGLGLALSKKLAQMLGGDIKLLRSELGKGCTFEITVEAEALVQPEAKTTPNDKSTLSGPGASAIGGKRILLAEDSPDNQLLVQKLLAKWGAIVDVVENGQEAVTQASRTHYDAILMDMQMPVMDGYSATRILREKGYTKTIIAFTAHAMKEDRQQCLDAGCDDYLTKPVNLNQTLAVLAKFCSQEPSLRQNAIHAPGLEQTI
ncbi:MAG: response regulator, partial [Pseudobdellovibrionaceae bacterium]